MNFKRFIVPVFIGLGVIVSSISTIHSVEFFLLSNGDWMATFLAIAFEIGQIASLLAIMQAREMNMRVVWTLFLFLTFFQIMSNVFHSYKYLGDEYKLWTEVFFLGGVSELWQKRIVSFVLGGFLPLLSAGFTKVLVSYLVKTQEIEAKKETDALEELKKDLESEFKDKIENLINENMKDVELKKPEEIQQEITEAYLSARKEIQSSPLNKKIISIPALNDSILRLREKDFSLRFDRCLDIDPSLKKLPLLNSLATSNNVDDLDKFEKYLQSNISVKTRLENALSEYEKGLKNAKI